MIILRIEHEVANFQGWKKAFDGDPIGRKQSGVKRYHIYQPFDKQNYVSVDLEFDDLSSAQKTQKALEAMMIKVMGTIVHAPTIVMLNEIESKEY